MSQEWPLVGRTDELRRIRETVVDEGRGVVLAGAAGVGKSRLACESLELLARAGLATARVTATRAGSEIPLGAFAPLLPGDREPRHGAVDDRANLLHRCADGLLERAGGRRLVLAVDDAHLLDNMSATLVHQIAETDAATVLVTVRGTEPAPDPVVALWKGGMAERLELGGLGAAAVTEVLTTTLGATVDEAAVDELMARSRGNMLFLRELVFGARAEGVLRREDALWRLVGELHPTDRLVELVELRLAGLTPPERELMEVVAFGEPLGTAELTRLGDEAVADRLERKGLLRSGMEGLRLTIRLGHPIYGEVLRDRMPALRARSIARSLAETVEATGARRREDLLRIASWRLVGGGAEPSLMLEAAVLARWRYDFSLAERLARAAIEEGAGFEAAVLAAQLASLLGRSTQADAELGALADAAELDSQRALVALIRLDNRVIYSGTIDEGLRIAEEAEEALTDTEVLDEIVARRVALLLAKEGPRSAARVAEPLLRRASGRALAWACMPGSYSLARMGRIEAALEAAKRGYQAQTTLATPTDWYPWMHSFYEAEALAHSGRFVEARDLASAQYRDGVSSRSLEAQAMFSWQLAKTVADRGHVDDAVRNARKAISIYRQLGRPQFMDFCLIYLAQALALGQRHREAAEALHSLEELGLGPSFFMGVDLLQTRGWISVAGGNLRQARETFLHAADEGERVGDVVGAVAALHSAARVGYAKDVAVRLSGLAADIEGQLAPARRAHTEALAAVDPGALKAVSAAFESMGAGLLAAEAAADSAVAFSRLDDQRSAASAGRRAAWLAGHCGGADTPALRAVGSRARLTTAEWEAAQLAASGRSNRDIAAELVVSVRTIENRLQHVYGKLGVNGRQALAEALTTVQGPGAARSPEHRRVADGRR